MLKKIERGIPYDRGVMERQVRLCGKKEKARKSVLTHTWGDKSPRKEKSAAEKPTTRGLEIKKLNLRRKVDRKV